MTKGRLEAFSDGVFAVIITIMVLELKAPHGADWTALRPLLPAFLTYVLSYVFLGIYWNNHHHMLHAVDRDQRRVLWANLHLLFWLSLVPFVTGWMGDNHFAALPTAAYGACCSWPAIAYLILERRLLQRRQSAARRRHRQRHQGQAVGGALFVAHPARLRPSVDRRRDLRLRRADVARAGSAHRTHDGNGGTRQRDHTEKRRNGGRTERPKCRGAQDVVRREGLRGRPSVAPFLRVKRT